MTSEDIKVLEEIIAATRYQIKQGALPSGLVPVYLNEKDAEALERVVQHFEKEALQERKMSTKECRDTVALYNQLCPSLPAVKQLTETRITALRGAKKLLGDTSFYDFFSTCEASDFISGRSGKWTGASFDWILKKANLVKILEGNFDNKRSATGGDSSFDVNEFFRAALRRSEARSTKHKT